MNYEENELYTYKWSDDEEDDERSGDVSTGADLSVTHGRHGNQQPVHAAPICQRLTVLVVVERVSIVLWLSTQHTVRSSHHTISTTLFSDWAHNTLWGLENSIIIQIALHRRLT